MFYLRTNLKGEALKVVESTSVNADVYDTALQILKDRFDNSYIAINSHLRATFELPIVTKDAISLKNLIIKTKLHLKSTDSLNVSTGNWDPIITYILTQKLHEPSRFAWELYRPSKNASKLDEFYKLIEHRCTSFETIANDQPSSSKLIQTMNTSKPKHFKLFFF